LPDFEPGPLPDCFDQGVPFAASFDVRLRVVSAIFCTFGLMFDFELLLPEFLLELPDVDPFDPT
jgi:hypothetical protein